MPIIISLIQQEATPDTICRVLKMCPHASAPQPLTGKVGDNCAVCKLVVNQVESALFNNKTEQEISDMLVNDVVVLELKCVEELQPIHVAQVLTYLKMTNLQLGLLINFKVDLLRKGIKRIVNNL